MQNKNKLRAQILLNPAYDEQQKIDLLRAVDEDQLYGPDLSDQLPQRELLTQNYTVDSTVQTPGYSGKNLASTGSTPRYDIGTMGSAPSDPSAFLREFSTLQEVVPLRSARAPILATNPRYQARTGVPSEAARMQVYVRDYVSRLQPHQAEIILNMDPNKLTRTQLAVQQAIRQDKINNPQQELRRGTQQVAQAPAQATAPQQAPVPQQQAPAPVAAFGQAPVPQQQAPVAAFGQAPVPQQQAPVPQQQAPVAAYGQAPVPGGRLPEPIPAPAATAPMQPAVGRLPDLGYGRLRRQQTPTATFDAAGAAKVRPEEAGELGMVPMVVGQVGVPVGGYDPASASEPEPEPEPAKTSGGIVGAVAGRVRREVAETGGGPTPPPEKPAQEGDRVVETTEYSKELGGGSTTEILRETPEARADRKTAELDQQMGLDLAGDPGRTISVPGKGWVPTSRSTTSTQYPPTYKIVDEDVSEADFWQGTQPPQTVSKSRVVDTYDPRVLDAPPMADVATGGGMMGGRSSADFGSVGDMAQLSKLDELSQQTKLPVNELRYLLRKEGVKVGDVMYSSVENPDGTFSIVETYQAPQSWYGKTDENIAYLSNATGKSYADVVRELSGEGLLIEDENGAVNYYLQDGKLMARREEAVDPVLDYQRSVEDYRSAMARRRLAQAETASATEEFSRQADLDALVEKQQYQSIADQQTSAVTDDLLTRVQKMASTKIEPSRWANGSRAGNGLGAIAYIMAMGQLGGAGGIKQATDDLNGIMDRDIQEQLITRDGQIKAIEEIRKTIPDINVKWKSKQDLADVLANVRKAKFHSDVIAIRNANWKKLHPDSRLSEEQHLMMDEANANEALQASALVTDKLKTMAQSQTLTEGFDRGGTVTLGARKPMSVDEAIKLRNLRAGILGLPSRDPDTGQLVQPGGVDVTSPSYVPGFGMARSEPLAKDALKQSVTIQKGNSLTTELLQYEEKGTTNWSRADAARVSQIVRELGLMIKNKENLGALDAGSMTVMNEMAANPLSWTFAKKGAWAKIHRLHDGWADARDTIKQNYIIGGEGAAGMPGGGGQSSGGPGGKSHLKVKR